MLHRLTNDGRIWDTCVVGTGPVGMAVALELERLGHEALVLESGGMEPGDDEAVRAEIVDPERHAAMELAVRRALGGTSWTWGGRCVAFDDIDWMDRPYVGEGARWPVGDAEVGPYYGRAAEYLLCGSGKFTVPCGAGCKADWRWMAWSAGRSRPRSFSGTRSGCWIRPGSTSA